VGCALSAASDVWVDVPPAEDDDDGSEAEDDDVYDARDDLIQGEKRHIQALYEYHLHLSTMQTLMGSVLDIGQ